MPQPFSGFSFRTPSPRSWKLMPEFFIVANSKAAPIVSDTTRTYVEADNAEDALVQFIREYSHPAGLYAARAYASADAFEKGQPYLDEWLSFDAIKAWS